jgi:hypothetical protein
MDPTTVSVYERIFSFYGFPLLCLMGLVYLVWQTIKYAASKLDPMLVALTAYFVSLPEENRKHREILEEIREQGKVNSKQIEGLRASIFENFLPAMKGQGVKNGA